ncbi:MAG TPA: class I SAM-dependent methyltransferase [Acidilobales archaeon]|nr:class I SAM-dependent methyltransferase [Acidilobales archaeon]
MSTMVSDDEIKKCVKEVYDAIAEGFQHLRSKPWVIVSKLHGCRLIVDVGCGVGTQLIPFLRQGAYGVCLDISSSMLTKAKEKLSKLGLLNYVDLIKGDAEYLPFRDSSIECLLSIATIHHLPSKSRINALREIERVLRVRGKALITVWSLCQPKFLAKLLINVLKYLIGLTPSPKDFLVPWRHKGKIYLRYYHLFTKGELMKLITKSTSLKIIDYGIFNLRKTIYHQNYYALVSKELM